MFLIFSIINFYFNDFKTSILDLINLAFFNPERLLRLGLKLFLARAILL